MAPQASYLQSDFLGGEVSKSAQGRYDLPAYKTQMAACLNWIPLEIGSLGRRPGTAYAGHTRGGARGRNIRFDFEQAIPYTAELTDGFVRFRNGATLITVNALAVVAISTANPAVVQVAAGAYATGATVVFPAANMPLLQNRQFTVTHVDGTHFSLQDALTGANIDGSTLGAFTAATVAQVYELATAYTGGAWSSIRAVQAETTDLLLTATVAPQALTVTTLPTATTPAAFAIAPAAFNDGPYLDPFTNGVQANPNQKTGVVQLTLSFQPYVATTAYPVGAFVSSSSVNYESLVDQNVGNTPVSSPSDWAVASSGAAINGGRGFLGTDVGRLVRLFSEPAAWVAGTTYAAATVVSYNPTGEPGAATYWQALVGSNTGHIPGTDLTNWEEVTTGAALWTWGKIVSLTNQIVQTGGPVLAHTSNMVGNAGVAAAFDGNDSKTALNCAEAQTTGTNASPAAFAGQNYTGTAQAIGSATAFPSTDFGFTSFVITQGGSSSPNVTVNLRAKASAPASSSDGTLLGTTGLIPNTVSPVTITSNDQVTTWNFVWFEIIGQTQGALSPEIYIVVLSQALFFNPPGTGTSNGINVELLGPPLLYTTPINTWRLGAYSNTTGWPTCGCYHAGRIWLGGAIANRFDGSVSNGVSGATVNFAPTDQNGDVLASSAIDETLNSDGVNPIFWMRPDLQGIIAGTQAGEWLIFAPAGGSIAPTNIDAHQVTRIGNAFVEPVRTEHTNVFVQRYSIKLMEYFADVFSGKFSAPNLADKAAHITRTGIAELAYTQAATPVIWGRCNDGSLFGVTYKRDTLMTSQGPTFYGWHRQALGSGRTVESICSGPSVGGNLDALTMVTVDTSGIRHVEVMTDTQDEDTAITALWLLDDAVTPTSYSVNNATPAPYGGMTINGLWHLNGKTVQVFAGGLDCGLTEAGVVRDFVVTNGSVVVPFGDGVSAGSGEGLFTAALVASFATIPIVVGFTYNSDGQLLRPNAAADTGARNGPGFGKIGRAHWYAIQCVNTSGLSVGTDFTKLDPVIFRDDSSDSYPINQPFTGIQTDVLEDTYSFDTQICWRVSRPWPAMITVVGGYMEKADK